MKTIPPFIHIPVFPFSVLYFSLSYSILSFFPLSTSNPLPLFPPSLTWVPLHSYSLLMTDNLECLSVIWCWRDGKIRRKWASCTCVRSHFLNCPERDLSAYVWISRTYLRYQSTYPLFQVWHMTVLFMLLSLHITLGLTYNIWRYLVKWKSICFKWFDYCTSYRHTLDGLKKISLSKKQYDFSDSFFHPSSHTHSHTWNIQTHTKIHTHILY